jgi:hypothetical protein
MRSVFFGFAVVSVLATSYAFGGEDMPSVVNHGSAPAASVTSAPAAVAAPVAAAPCDNCNCASKNCASRAAQPQLICVNGRCGEQRLYSVDARENEYSRNRLLGGKVVHKRSRTVVRPVR